MGLASRYTDIMLRIRAAETPRPMGGTGVVLVAVSKTQPVEAIEELYRFGHRDFGENYVQELVEKAEELKRRGCDEIRWHFIGHLQTNKVKALMPWVHAVHAVDSVKLARELAKRWKASGREGKLPVFLEVNIDSEPSKSGVSPEEALALAPEIAALGELELAGLMCIPSPGGSPETAFRRLHELELRCRPATGGGLSMGMTSDFEAAVREGATHVRIGTALFGARPKAG